MGILIDTSFTNELIVSSILIAIFFLILASFFIALLLLFQKRRQQHTKEMAQLTYNYEQALLKSQLEIQEETLRHISQEIHDNIGQVLSLAKLHLNTLPVTTVDRNAEAITTSKELVGKAIADLRSLSKSLHPDRVNKLGLEENIRHELDMLQRTHLYETHLQINGSVYKIPVQTQIILFRMVQEAISNIIKHANASTVDVLMDYEPLQFCLTVSDDGIGMNTDAVVNKQSGIGLINMQNRSQILGASFEVNPAYNTGTSIRICLPVAAKPPNDSTT